jgi:uncharacterized protein with GYD domain
MATYIVLVSWTDQGVRTVNDSAKRLDAGRKLLEDMGGRLEAVYMTLGEYDMVSVYEAPDDAIAARYTLMLSKQGNLRTKTLKAFPEAAYREIIASLK